MTSAGGLVAASGQALAQSGSALYSVGESSSRTRPAAVQPKVAAPAAALKSPLIRSAPKEVPAAAPRASSNTAPKAAAVSKAGSPKVTSTRAASGKSSASKPVAQRKTGGKTRGRAVARKGSSPIALNGRWHDSQCIPLTGVTHQPPLYVKRQYEFIDARKAWRLDAAVYASHACVIDSRMLTYYGEGSFAVTGKSSVARNAYDASFKIDRWSATPDSRDGVLTLLNGRCGSGDFEQGRPLDLSGTGCPTLGIRSITQAPREVELVSVSDGKFFLGTRSFVPGLRDDRPAQLSSYGLTRTR